MSERDAVGSSPHRVKKSRAAARNYLGMARSCVCQREHESSVLGVYPDNGSFLHNFKGDAILAFLLIKLNRSRKEKVECVGCCVALASHEFVSVEIQRQSVGSSRSFLLLCLRLIEILTGMANFLEADRA